MATRFNGSLKDQISEEGRSLILLLVPYHPFHSPTHHITFPQLDYILHPQLGYNLHSTFYFFSLTIHSTLAHFHDCVLLVL